MIINSGPTFLPPNGNLKRVRDSSTPQTNKANVPDLSCKFKRHTSSDRPTKIAKGIEQQSVNENIDPRLFTAILSHNVQKVSDVALGTNINAIDIMGRTPLFYAMQTGDEEVVEALLNAGADCDISVNGTSLLHVALAQPNLKILSLIITHTKDINSKNNSCEPILHHAVSLGNLDAVRMLTEGGADVNAENNKNQSAMFLAVMLNKKEIIAQLLNSGAEVDQRDKSNKTPSIVAIENDDIETLALLLDYQADVNLKDGEEDTLAQQAVLFNNLPILELLYSRGADVKAPFNKGGNTPLFFCVCNKQNEIAKKLISWGCNVNEQVKSMTPLMQAAEVNNELIDSLIAAGADVNIQDIHGRTALHYAMSSPLSVFEKILHLSKNKNPIDKGDFSLYQTIKGKKDPNSQAKIELMKRVIPQELPLESEYRKRISAGSYWEVDHESRIDISKTVTREFPTAGGDSIYFVRQYQKRLKECLVAYPDLFPKNKIQPLIAALLLSENQNAQDSFRAWNNGEPVIIDSGFKGHSTKILIWQNHWIYCDRDPETDLPEIFTASLFDKSKLKKEMIKKIIDNTESNEQEVQQILDSLKTKLKFTKANFQYYLDRQEIIQMQTVGNCPVASIEGIVYAYLVLFEWLQINKKVNFTPIAEAQESIVNNLTVFMKIRSLEKYIKHHQKNPSVEMDKAFLNSILSKGLMNESDAEFDDRLLLRYKLALTDISKLVINSNSSSKLIKLNTNGDSCK